jgi:hypothetical protein
MPGLDRASVQGELGTRSRIKSGDDVLQQMMRIAT